MFLLREAIGRITGSRGEERRRCGTLWERDGRGHVQMTRIEETRCFIHKRRKKGTMGCDGLGLSALSQMEVLFCRLRDTVSHALSVMLLAARCVRG